MKRLWPTEALEFRDSVAGALLRLGEVDFTRRCEADPSLRSTELEPVLEGLSLHDLDPAEGPVEAAAAALGMRAAGAVACPWPLVARVATPTELRGDFDAVYVTDRRSSRLEHLDLAERALAVDLRSGELYEATATGPVARAPLDPFGVPFERGAPVGDDDLGARGTVTVLSAFWVLGALDRVLDQVSAYARERHQFGRPIASFGAIQWRLSELALAREGLSELAALTLLRSVEGEASEADFLALRLGMLESASNGLAHGHQVLGAIGLCEEHDVTVLDRHLQPLLRRAGGIAATTGLLADSIARVGFDAIYPIRPA